MVKFPQPPSGHFDGPVHLFPLRAYFDDTDAGGIVYHANYLRWCERGRSELLRSLGIDTRGGMEAGLGTYAITELAIRYLRPAKLGDAIVVMSEALEVGAASWRMRQRIMRGEELLADATMRIGFVAPNGKPARHPADWRHALATLLPDRTPA